MATPFNFAEEYKSFTNTDLLQILDRPEEYQEQAIVAAKAELEKRNLTPSAIQLAREPLEARQAKKIKEQEMINAAKDQIRKAGSSLLDNINPIQEGVFTTERLVRILGLCFVVIIIYNLKTNYRLLWTSWKDFPKFPFESACIIMPIILLHVGTIFFLFRKKAGWILSVLHLSFEILLAVYMIFVTISFRPAADDLVYFRQPSFTTYILPLLIYGSLLYMLCRKDIRNAFAISSQATLATIWSGFGLAALLLYGSS